jgi:hypothetical protein
MPSGVQQALVESVGGKRADLWAAVTAYTRIVNGTASPRIAIAHWNGSAWSLVDVPLTSRPALLGGIWVASDGSGFAVGRFHSASDGWQPLLLAACGI